MPLHLGMCPEYHAIMIFLKLWPLSLLSFLLSLNHQKQLQSRFFSLVHACSPTSKVPAIHEYIPQLTESDRVSR